MTCGVGIAIVDGRPHGWSWSRKEGGGEEEKLADGSRQQTHTGAMTPCQNDQATLEPGESV